MEFLIIIPIALYMLVLIPAFMFTWEGSVFEGIGCCGWLCVILGFPGALLALVIKLVVKMVKYPIEKERQERIAEEAQRRAQQHTENTGRVEQKVTTLFEKIKGDLFIGRYTRPTKIILYYNGIGLFNGDTLVKKIAFSSYDLDNLSLYDYWWCTDGTEPPEGEPFNELEYLAKLINTHFQNRYTINDKIKRSEASVGSDMERYTLHISKQMHTEMYIIDPHISHGVTADAANKAIQRDFAKHEDKSEGSFPTPAKSDRLKGKCITSYNEYINTLTNLYLKGGKKLLSDAEILQFIRDYDLDRRFGIRIEDVKTDLSSIESTYK